MSMFNRIESKPAVPPKYAYKLEAQDYAVAEAQKAEVW